MGIAEISIAILSAAVPLLLVIALLVGIFRLLKAVEDTASTLRRIEKLLKQQRDQE